VCQPGEISGLAEDGVVLDRRAIRRAPAAALQGIALTSLLVRAPQRVITATASIMGASTQSVRHGRRARVLRAPRRAQDEDRVFTPLE